MGKLSIDDLSSLLLDHIGSSGSSVHGETSAGIPGFVPASEGGSLAHGVVGGKGRLQEGTDISTVLRGGIYTYSNLDTVGSPWSYDYYKGNCNMIVLANYEKESDYKLSNKLVHQIVITNNIIPDVAIRYISPSEDEPRSWVYLTDVQLWKGSAGAGTTITLSDSLIKFKKLTIETLGFMSASTESSTFLVDSNTSRFDIRNFNLPNASDTPDNIQFLEARLALKSSTELEITESSVRLSSDGNLVADSSINNIFRVTRITGRS